MANHHLPPTEKIMQNDRTKRVPGKLVPLAEIHERGKALRQVMLSQGMTRYAEQFLQWNKAWSGDFEIQDRIRQLGMGRGHKADLELLEQCEAIAWRKLAEKAKKANIAA